MDTFCTHLTASQCLNRVQMMLNEYDANRHLDNSLGSMFVGGDRNSVFCRRKGIIGKVNVNKMTFHLQMCSPNFRNSFAMPFYGKIMETDEGTVIQGKFKLHLFVKVFLMVWFGFFLFVPLCQEIQLGRIAWGGVLGSSPVFLLGAALVLGAKRMDKANRTQLLKLIYEKLDLTEWGG